MVLFSLPDSDFGLHHKEWMIIFSLCLYFRYCTCLFTISFLGFCPTICFQQFTYGMLVMANPA